MYSHVATTENRVFPAARQHVELVREAAADGAAVGLDRTELHVDTAEDALICLEHAPVLPVRVGIVHMEGVAVLHDELAAAHQAEARANLVAELRLNLEDVHRKLLVALHDLADDVGDHLFVGRPEAEVRALAILESQQLAAVELPAPALLPKLGWLHRGHQQLLTTVARQLFTDDLLELPDAAQRQRQVVVDTGGHLLNHAAAHHQLLADDVGVARRLAVGLEEKLGLFHELSVT